MANTPSELSSELDAAQSAGTVYPLDAPGRISTPGNRARRQVVKGALGTLAAAALGWLTWTRSLFPPGTPAPQNAPATPVTSNGFTSGGVKVGPVDGFAAGDPPKVVTPKESGPAFVVENNGGAFRVLSAVCTHQGCNVDWSPEKKCLLCPCHGAQFDSSGKVLKGPAKLPLPTLASRVENGVLFVEG